MKEIQERLEDISQIRNLLEQQTKFLSLSGLSGVFAGLTALGGAAIAWYYMDSVGQGQYLPAPGTDLSGGQLFDGITLTLLAIAMGILAVAVGGALFFSRRVATKKGVAFWNASAKRMVVSLAIPLSAGAAYSVAQLYQGNWEWIASNMLIFYGLALLNASKYTVGEIRLLGLTEVALGIASAIFWKHGFLFWVIGFGVMHIVYGTYLYFKYER